jgi:hypothetical protein
MAATRELDMATRKPKKKGEGDGMGALNVRVPLRLIAQLEGVANELGTDKSHLLRMMLVEFLPVYEQRAGRVVRGGEG